MKKLSMKSTKQEIYSAYNEATETVEELQQSQLKTAVLHSISNAITFVLYQLKGDKLAVNMKLVATSFAPVLVFLYVCLEWAFNMTHKLWQQASNALVLEPVVTTV